jgi:hypothetical protein
MITVDVALAVGTTNSTTPLGKLDTEGGGGTVVASVPKGV